MLPPNFDHKISNLGNARVLNLALRENFKNFYIFPAIRGVLSLKMRITLYLKSLKDVSQKETFAKYHSALNSWFYHKLDESKNYKFLHDKKSFKFFCFSNLIGVKEGKILQNRLYKITFSFADLNLFNEFKALLKEGEKIELGELSFEYRFSKEYDIRIDNFMVIETPSVIVVTDHKGDKTVNLDYLKEDEKGRYLELLSRNLIRKFNRLNQAKQDAAEQVDESYELFKNVEIEPIYGGKKCIPLGDDKTLRMAIGNKLRFKLGFLDEVQKKAFQVGIDSGFGIQNAFGMGFVMENMQMRVKDD